MQAMTLGDDGGLPPGQSRASGWPLLHYGRVPRFDPQTWDFQIAGATADGATRTWRHADIAGLPQVEVVAAVHCVTRMSMGPATWSGVPVAALLDLAPPAPGVDDVLTWAAYGYSSNVTLADLRHPGVILASHRDGLPLTPEQGWPYRLIIGHLYGWKGPKWIRGLEYLTTLRRGFWEERGYHLRGRAWEQERYAYQEDPASDGRTGSGATGS